MTFHVFGLNHESAPVRVREAFALGADAQHRLYESLQLPEEAGVVVLTTCNRTEVYLFGYAEHADAVRQGLAEEAGVPWPEDVAFTYTDEEAVRHVLQVASGLRSLVLGDNQILAQFKEAYQTAVEHDAVSAVLHRLMHAAFRTAKRVATETALAQGEASVSTAAVATARAFFEGHYADGLASRRVLLVGTGQMGVLALQALRSYPLGRLSVTNRTAERAQEVGAEAGADVVEWDDRYEALRRADLVLVATGANEPVLEAACVPEATQAKLIVDIAVPRNVDPAVGTVPGYTLFDLDLLNERLVRVEEQRRTEVPRAEVIVEEVLSEFVSWFFHQQALQPAIHALRDTFDAIRRQEIERHAHRFADADQRELDRLTNSILQKLLAVPIVRLKSTDPESIDFVRGIRMLRTLFSRPDCDDASAEESAACPVDHQDETAKADALHERIKRRLQTFEALHQDASEDE